MDSQAGVVLLASAGFPEKACRQGSHDASGHCAGEHQAAETGLPPRLNKHGLGYALLEAIRRRRHNLQAQAFEQSPRRCLQLAAGVAHRDMGLQGAAIFGRNIAVHQALNELTAIKAIHDLPH